jgi:hypothetical protein
MKGNMDAQNPNQIDKAAKFYKACSFLGKVL